MAATGGHLRGFSQNGGAAGNQAPIGGGDSQGCLAAQVKDLNGVAVAGKPSGEGGGEMGLAGTGMMAGDGDKAC
jgi:hypothetical protein